MLTFDPVKHLYTFDGRPVISVTQAMQSAGLIDPTYYTPESRERGTQVHFATQFLDEGDLDWDSIHPVIHPYLDAYCLAKQELKFNPILVECRVFNPIYYFAGTLDRTGTIFTGTEREEKIILDIKTGEVEAWARVQIAAYDSCLDEKLPRYVLQLRPNGTYKLHGPFTDRSDFKIFLNCVSIANWKLSNKMARLAA